MINIYLNDQRIRDEIPQIVLSEALSTTLVALTLIVLLLWVLRRALVQPLNAVTQALRNTDANGIPLRVPPGLDYREIAPLTETLGNMIKETRHSHDALAEERSRLQSVIDGTRAGTWEWNVQTGAVRFNARWAEIIGYTLEELEPFSIETWMKFTHPDDLVVSNALLERHFAGELPYYETEARMRHKDGHWVWVLDRGKLISKTAEGKPLWMAGTHQDITARKEAEQRLVESEQLLRSSLEAIGEAFVIYDADDRLVYCNEEYRQTYPSIAEMLKPGARFEDIIRTWAERGAPEVATRDVETWVRERLARHHEGGVIVQQVGADRWVRIVEKRTPHGYTVGFRVDISELMRARKAAEASAEAKSRFLATMSHEIRTPLNGILGMAQLLLAPEVDATERRDCARVILHSGQTLLALLNDILDLSKIEAGKMTIESGVVAPDDLLRETESLFTETASQKGVALSCRWLGPVGRRYEGDPHRLQQMLTNLVSNALKFTHEGSISVEARELSGPDAGSLQLEFSVADTGIGIPAEKQALLFKPFSQIDDTLTRQHGGTGLGLSIVKNLARLMGGDVGVESTPGNGSRFWFRVRVRPLAVDSDVRLTEDSEGLPATWQQFTGRVLIVEDNATNRLVIDKLLVRLGLETRSVENGRIALDLLASGEAFDLVLMDVQMPVMDGLSASRAIREQETLSGKPRLPIVALTAGAFPEDRAACQAAGMDDFIAKPVQIDTLVAVLAKWLPTASPAPLPEPINDGIALDWPAIRSQIETLLPMLAAGQFSAIDAFAHLRKSAEGTSLAARLAKIDTDLQAFRFPQVRSALLDLLQTLPEP